MWEVRTISSTKVIDKTHSEGTRFPKGMQEWNRADQSISQYHCPFRAQFFISINSSLRREEETKQIFPKKALFVEDFRVFWVFFPSVTRENASILITIWNLHKKSDPAGQEKILWIISVGDLALIYCCCAPSTSDAKDEWSWKFVAWLACTCKFFE